MRYAALVVKTLGNKHIGYSWYKAYPMRMGADKVHVPGIGVQTKKAILDQAKESSEAKKKESMGRSNKYY